MELRGKVARFGGKLKYETFEEFERDRRRVSEGLAISTAHPSEETFKKVLKSLEGRDLEKEAEDAYRLAIAMRGDKRMCDDNGYGELS